VCRSVSTLFFVAFVGAFACFGRFFVAAAARFDTSAHLLGFTRCLFEHPIEFLRDSRRSPLRSGRRR